MSAKLLFYCHDIKEVKYKDIEYQDNLVTVKASVSKKYINKSKCPKCGSKHIICKGKKIRKFRLIPLKHTQKWILSLELQRFKCKKCNSLWWIKLPFMKGKSNLTKSFIQYILDLLKIGVIKSVADLLNLNWNTVKNIHKNHLQNLYSKIDYKKLSYVAVDEFSIKKGHNYMTVVIDLKTGRIIFSSEGKSRESLAPFLLILKKEAPQLKAIAMDMGKAFSSAVKEYLPSVDIVYDRFHVTSLINKTIDDIRKEQQKYGLEDVFKGNRFLFLKNYDSLDTNAAERLNSLLDINKTLFIAHSLKEQFRLFWMKDFYKDGKDFLKKWCLDAVTSGIHQLKKLAKTILKHSEGLLNYFKHKITTGPLEGLNNKIKTMKRQSYGFTDIEYFKLRLYHLHNQKITLI